MNNDNIKKLLGADGAQAVISINEARSILGLQPLGEDGKTHHVGKIECLGRFRVTTADADETKRVGIRLEASPDQETHRAGGTAYLAPCAIEGISIVADEKHAQQIAQLTKQLKMKDQIIELLTEQLQGPKGWRAE